MKQFKEQKEEAERFAKLQKQRVSLLALFLCESLFIAISAIQAKQITIYLTWKIFHLNKKIAALDAGVEEERGGSEQYEQQMTELENQLKDARRQQARTNKELMRLEKMVTQKTKEMDDQRPELVKVAEKIRYANRKLKTAEDNIEKARKDHEKETSFMTELRKDHEQLTRTLAKYEETISKRTAEKGPQLDEAQLAEYNEKKDEVRRHTFAEKQELTNLQRQKKTEEENKLRLEENMQGSRNRKQILDDDQRMLTERQEKVSLLMVFSRFNHLPRRTALAGRSD